MKQLLPFQALNSHSIHDKRFEIDSPCYAVGAGTIKTPPPLTLINANKQCKFIIFNTNRRIYIDISICVNLIYVYFTDSFFIFKIRKILYSQ